MGGECLETDCKKQPSYNFKDIKKGIYCNLHKKEGMINVVDKRCKEDGCNTIPNYNYINMKPEYCTTHKKKDMINVKNKKCKECDKTPAYNSLNLQRYDGKTPLHIALEKYLQYFDISSPRHPYIPILRSLFKRMKGISKEETGLDLQMKGGSTALHLVLLTKIKSHCNSDMFYRIQLVKVLCKLQIDTTILTNAGETAYDIACEDYGADSDIAKLLEIYPH